MFQASRLIGFLFVCWLLATVDCIRLTTTERNVIVSLHNDVRTNVNPPANPAIPNMVYSTTVETTAANYADGCVIAHNPNRGMLGENIYAESPYTTFENALRNAMRFWAGEVQYYTITPTSQSCVQGQVCGHYTQVVWENSTNLGCGVANCNNLAFVVCNYQDPGNWNNRLPYRVATGSSPPPPAASPTSTSTSTRTRTRTPTSTGTSTRSASQNAPPPPSPSRTPSKSLSKSPTRTPTRTPTSSSSAQVCQSGCPAGFCGSYSSCGFTYNCNCGSNQFCNSGTCANCPNVCTGMNCGMIARANCASQSCSCSDTSMSCSSNVCQAPACNVAQQCAASGKSCGTWSICGQQASCGTCSSSQTCSNGQCVAVPCGGACDPVKQVCTNNACVCAPGYTQTSNGCTAVVAGSGPNFQQDFRTVKGAPFAFLLPNQLTVYGALDTVIAWEDSIGVVSKQFTVVEFDVTSSGGAFGVIFRLGQASYPNDRVSLYVSNIGASAVMNFVFYYQNNEYAYNFGQFGGWRPGKNHVKATMTISGGNVLIQWEQNGWMYQGAVTDVYANAGAFGYYISSGGSPYMENLIMFTTSTITVSLVNCQDIADWEARFLAATGSPPGTSVQILNTDGLSACKEAGGAKEAAAGAFTFSVTSSTIASEAIAHNFVVAVEAGDAAVAGLGVASAKVVAGEAGAVLAGAPVIGPATFVAPVGGAAAGGGAGGGAAGGLSGGAIAGIVIGSVAGGLLILGVTTLVVAAIIVAAVVVAKKSSSDDVDSVDRARNAEAEEQPRGGIRQSLYQFFSRPKGGVDVMGNNAGGHHSITNRQGSGY